MPPSFPETDMTRTKIVLAAATPLPPRSPHFPAVRKSTFLTDFSLQPSKENRRQVAVRLRPRPSLFGRPMAKGGEQTDRESERALVAFRSSLSWWPPLPPLPNKTAEGKEMGAAGSHAG